jgi:solute carrier family 39 (zinc transporter), member 1/2/3
MRLLLENSAISQQAHLHHHSDAHSTALQLRVAAIFVIFVGSLLGALPPLLSVKFGPPSASVGSALRAFAGGVILALALVHIVPHSVQEFSAVSSFPFAGVLMLAGVTLMLFIEHGLQAYYSEPDVKEAENASPTAGGGSKDPTTGMSTEHVASGAQDDFTPDTATQDATIAAKDLTADVVGATKASATHACAVGHAHAAADTPARTGRDGPNVSKVAAWLMELGCVFHSVIIGIDLGVTTDATALTPFLVALIFHQLIEGVGLGTVLAAANFKGLKPFVMAVVYSATTPLGVAVGIGMASSYDPESRRAVATKGCLDSLSGGLLLYIALVHLVCPAFWSRELRGASRLVACASFALGGAIMCTLAIWA